MDGTDGGGGLGELDSVTVAYILQNMPPVVKSIDAGLWMPLEAADSLIHSTRESFRARVQDIGAGEHVIVIRATDSAGNAGLAKVVVR